MKKAKTLATHTFTCAMTAIIAIVSANHLETGIRTNKAGLEIIGNAEGCRRDAYLCPAGRWTQGVGSTYNVDKNRLKSDEEIAKDFTFALKQAEQCLNAYANGAKLPDNVFSAFASFTFHVGCTKARKYTVFELLRDNRITEACYRLPIYSKALVDGKMVELPGIKNRREKEKNLCLTK